MFISQSQNFSQSSTDKFPLYVSMHFFASRIVLKSCHSQCDEALLIPQKKSTRCEVSKVICIDLHFLRDISRGNNENALKRNELTDFGVAILSLVTQTIRCRQRCSTCPNVVCEEQPSSLGNETFLFFLLYTDLLLIQLIQTRCFIWFWQRLLGQSFREPVSLCPAHSPDDGQSLLTQIAPFFDASLSLLQIVQSVSLSTLLHTPIHTSYWFKARALFRLALCSALFVEWTSFRSYHDLDELASDQLEQANHVSIQIDALFVQTFIFLLDR